MYQEPIVGLSEADLDAVVGGAGETSVPQFNNMDEMENYMEGQFEAFQSNMHNVFDSYKKKHSTKNVNKTAKNKCMH
jgi:hypothetical protein